MSADLPSNTPARHVPQRDRETWLALQEALGGRYVLDGVLGEGGMGIVYLARERALDRFVALKILPPALANARRRERFLREARVAARLRHDHIVPIHTVDQAGPFVYYTMDYIRGGTLSDRILESPLPVGEVTRVLRDVARALHYAHEQGIIHRDLKPNNILMERASGRAYVADFGLARVLTESPIAGAGRTFGTFAYVSPEQAAGRPADRRSDVYSLGVLGWVMATGQPLFWGSPKEVLNHHISTPAPTLPVVGEYLDTTLARAVGRCLAKHPDQRYQTAGELAADLSQAPELRSELPAPLGHFVNRLAKQSTHATAAAVVALFGLSVAGSAAEAGRWGTAAGALGFLGLLFAFPVLGALGEARHLLEQGYTRADILHALHMDLGRQRRQQAARWGPARDAPVRWLRRLVAAAWGLFGVGMLAAVSPVNFPEGLVANSMLFGAVGGVIGGGILIRLERRRNQLTGWRWLRFGESALGEWALKLAGVGLGARAVESEPAALPLPPGAEAAEPNAVPEVGDVRHLAGHCVRRIQGFREASEARRRDGKEPTPEEIQLERTLEQHQAALEALIERLRPADAGTADAGSLTRDIEAVLKVCEMLEGLVEGREWGF